MGWWQISADTLAGSRFVISPLAETTASLIALDRGVAAHPGERQWLDAHRAAYRAYAIDHPVIPAIMRVAATRWWVPSLVTAPPSAATKCPSTMNWDTSPACRQPRSPPT